MGAAPPFFSNLLCRVSSLLDWPYTDPGPGVVFSEKEKAPAFTGASMVNVFALFPDGFRFLLR